MTRVSRVQNHIITTVVAFALLSTAILWRSFSTHSDKIWLSADSAQTIVLSPELGDADHTQRLGRLSIESVKCVLLPCTSHTPTDVPYDCIDRIADIGPSGIRQANDLAYSSKRSVRMEAAQIYSKRDVIRVLAVESNTPFSIYLNGTCVLQATGQDDRFPAGYPRLASIQIKRGRNDIVVRSAGGSNDGEITLKILTQDRGRRLALDSTQFNIVSNPLLRRQERLRLFMPQLFARGDFAICIVALHITVRKCDRIVDGSDNTLSTNGLPNGEYKLIFRINDTTVEDRFLIGGSSYVDREIQLAKRFASRWACRSDNIAPLILRRAILESPMYEHPASRDWQQKMIDLSEMAVAIRGSHRCIPVSGASLESFTSTIDGAKQYYRIFKPHDADRASPLIIEVPYEQVPERPFLSSSFLSWPLTFRFAEAAAERLHAIYVVSDIRGNIGTAPLGEREALELLDHIRSLYSVNPARIYLYGVCEGGRRALTLAAHYPGVFAGVGVYGPLSYSPYGVASKESPNLVFSPTLLEQLKATPVVLICGTRDSAVSRSQLSSFADQLNHLGGHVLFRILQDGTHKQPRLEQMIFPELTKLVKVESACRTPESQTSDPLIQCDTRSNPANATIRQEAVAYALTHRLVLMSTVNRMQRRELRAFVQSWRRRFPTANFAINLSASSQSRVSFVEPSRRVLLIAPRAERDALHEAQYAVFITYRCNGTLYLRIQPAFADRAIDAMIHETKSAFIAWNDSGRDIADKAGKP